MSSKEDIASRIVFAMNFYKEKTGIKITWNGLIKKLNMSAGSSTNWKKGVISNDTIEKIAEVLDVSYYWLLTGKGSVVNYGVENYSSNEDRLIYIGQQFIDFVAMTEKIAQAESRLKQLRVVGGVKTRF